MEEENVENVLGISDNTNTDHSDTEDNNVVTTLDNSAEKTLKTIATIILWLGIIAAIVSFFTVCFVIEIDPSYHYSVYYTVLLVTTICTFLGALASWAVLNVIANISLTLKNIDRKLK